MTITSAKQLSGYEELNYLAKIIIDILDKNDMGLAYCEDKIERLTGKNKYECLFWATHALDSTNKQLLANRLKVTIEDFEVCGVVLKAL